MLYTVRPEAFISKSTGTISKKAMVTKITPIICERSMLAEQPNRSPTR